jgi:hypothetical protein
MNPVTERLERELIGQAAPTPSRAGDDRSPDIEHIRIQTRFRGQVGDLTQMRIITLVSYHRSPSAGVAIGGKK